jgi:ribose/xylose/arabinose/galactoside ABC-type transport system permease subunit
VGFRAVTEGIRFVKSVVQVLARRLLASDLMVVALGAVYVAAVLPFCPELASRDQAFAILVNSAPLIVLTLGQLFVLSIGEIDLSVSGVAAMSSVAGGLVMSADQGWFASSPNAAELGLAAMLLVGVAIGAVQGLVVACLEAPAFLVTMASTTACSGAALWLTGGQRLSGLPTEFTAFVHRDLWGVPAMLAVALALAVGVHFLFQRLVIGRSLLAVGMNRRTAKVSGVRVTWVIVAAFALSGLFTAVASAVYTGRSETASPTFARELLLDALGAAVIGGASLSGGRASAVGAVLGAIFITLVGNSLTLLNLDYWHVLMAKGAGILIAAFSDSVRRRTMIAGGWA